MNPLPLSPRAHTHTFTVSSSYRNVPRCRRDHKMKARDGNRALVASHLPCRARAGRPLTKSQQQRHTYRASPEPPMLVSSSISSHPAWKPWQPVWCGRGTRVYGPESHGTAVTSVLSGLLGQHWRCGGLGYICLKGQQYPRGPQHLRDVNGRGQGSPTMRFSISNRLRPLSDQTSSFCAQFALNSSR